MREEHWRSITDIAEGQAGLVTSAQLRLTGTSPTAVDRLVREGRLAPVRNRVYLVAGVPDDPTRATWAVALVTPTCVVSHRSAGWLHGLLNKPPRLVQILTPPGMRVHMHGVQTMTGGFTDTDLDWCGGIRVTNVVRTLVDLFDVLPPDWVERLVHEAVMRNLCQYDDFRAAAAGNASLDFIGEGRGTTPLELEWGRILREAGLPEPAHQYQVVVGRRVFVLDYAWPESLLALEVDGFVAHRTRAAFDRDHDKLAALQAAGWSVVSATARSRRSHVLAALRRHLAFSPAAGAGENAR